jgi:hypothetical protein
VVAYHQVGGLSEREGESEKEGKQVIKVNEVGQEYCLPCSDEIDGVIVERGGVCVVCNAEREGE